MVLLFSWYQQPEVCCSYTPLTLPRAAEWPERRRWNSLPGTHAVAVQRNGTLTSIQEIVEHPGRLPAAGVSNALGS